jgi:predicted metal-dependent peptidase
MRILNNHGFYGLLLMHARYAIDEEAETAYTDGVRIVFSPTFLDRLNDRELDFVMMHEVLHMVLHHCLRGVGTDREQFNIACDIVVNSNILLENGMDLSSISLSRWGESMHLAPDGREGHLYTAEQVYEMLPRRHKSRGGNSGSGGGKGKNGTGPDLAKGGTWDDHNPWGTGEDPDVLRDTWVKNLAEAAEAVSIRDPSNTRGLLPVFAQRILEQLRQPQTDWRAVLQQFVQMEVNDYSFSPPDRRFQDSDFFLPDYNELGEGNTPNNILFMMDTSGSVSDKMLAAAFSEVRGAVEQFDGHLKGWLGFFDAVVVEPVAFEDVDELMKIRPAGGGGTRFDIIFRYVRERMGETPPACIIILTDGYAPFPQEDAAMGIPVLWLINNKYIDPPWGMTARIEG